MNDLKESQKKKLILELALEVQGADKYTKDYIIAFLDGVLNAKNQNKGE